MGVHLKECTIFSSTFPSTTFPNPKSPILGSPECKSIFSNLISL